MAVRRKVALGLAVAVAALATSALAEPFDQAPDAKLVRTVKDREACAAQASLVWCSPDQARPAEAEWTIEAVAKFQAKLTANFQYSYEADLPWRSSFDKAAGGGRWADDCDGLTFTLIDGLARQGFPIDKMWRAIVSPERNASYVMHMVGVVEVGGIYYVIGDTNHDGPYPLGKADFSPRLFSKVSEGAQWKRAALNSSVHAKVQKVSASAEVNGGGS